MKFLSNMTHPIPGYCYNVRGLCEEDNCECSKHPELLVENIERLKTEFPGWEKMADKNLPPLNGDGNVG